ncbi:MAG: hypothetical protein QM703_24805 [Gemmatales bacterium]
MSKLQQTIEQLYDVFADVRKPHHIDACPCCATNSEINTLLSKKLRELTSAELGSYASNALSTVGGVDDYLYFLPRILEITATDIKWWPLPEVTARAVHSSKLQAWPVVRREALEVYLFALIETIIEKGKYDQLDSWLCAIGRMEIEIHPYLKIIQNSKEAVLAIFNENANSLPRNKLSNAFWELPSRAHEDILDWLHSVPVMMIPLEAYGYIMPERKPYYSTG